VENERALWGIDVGGTKVEAVILEPLTAKVLHRCRVPTEADGGYEHILGQISQLVREMEIAADAPRPERIGIGTPGTFAPSTGLHKNSNTTCLNGRPFVADLSTALETNLVAANDANCFALAEATLGAARGFPTVFGVIMGTGVGGGLVVNGQVLNGGQGIAGEWGHNVIDPSGELTYSGRRGVVESVLSGPALERFYKECTGAERRLPEIIALADQGDLAAIQTRLRLLEFFGRAIAVVVNIFDPHAIVLGGGVSNLECLYTDGPKEVAKHVFNPTFTTPILPAEHGDSAGVLGAAMLTA